MHSPEIHPRQAETVTGASPAYGVSTDLAAASWTVFMRASQPDGGRLRELPKNTMVYPSAQELQNLDPGTLEGSIIAFKKILVQSDISSSRRINAESFLRVASAVLIVRRLLAPRMEEESAFFYNCALNSIL